MQIATTLRLPQELNERVSASCEDVGAVKNRVVVLALNEYLDGLPKRERAVLGHHAASFTMDMYVHLLPDDVGEPPESFDAVSDCVNDSEGLEAATG